MSEPLQLLLTGAPSASSLTACFPHSNLGHPDLVRLCHSSVQNPPVFSPLSRPREPPAAATPPISDLPLTRSATQFFHQAVLLPSQGFCTCCSLCLQHCSPQIFIWLPPAQPSGLCLTALSLAEHPVSKVTPPSPHSPSASLRYLSPIGKHLLSFTFTCSVASCLLSGHGALWAPLLQP